MNKGQKRLQNLIIKNTNIAQNLHNHLQQQLQLMLKHEKSMAGQLSKEFKPICDKYNIPVRTFAVQLGKNINQYSKQKGSGNNKP